MTFRIRNADAQRFRKLEIYDDSTLVALVVLQSYDEKIEILGNTILNFEREDIRDVYEAINEQVLKFRNLSTGTTDIDWIGNQWRHILGWKLAFKAFQSNLDRFSVSVDVMSGVPVTSSLTFPTIELNETDHAFERISSPSITHFRVFIET